MSDEIDWSKAPEGTTHANPEDCCGIWRRVIDGKSSWWCVNAWVSLHPRAYESAKGSYVKKP